MLPYYILNIPKPSFSSFFRLLILFIVLSIFIYPILTFGLEGFYPSVSKFDEFRVYEKGFRKESITCLLLFHMLIIVLSLLPDFVISTVKYIKEMSHMQEFDYKKDLNCRSVKFESKNKSKQVSFKECKLERVHDLSVEEESKNDRLQENTYNNSRRKKHKDSVQTINMKCTNAASNETPQATPLNGTDQQASYDNPTFESDITLHNLPSHSSQM